MTNDISQKTKILSATKLFADLSLPALQLLGNSFKELEFAAGQTIFREDEPGNSMMVVMEGELRVSFLAGRDEETLIVLRSGDFFGEMALLEDQPRTASVVAVTDVRLLEIERDSFYSFLSQDCASGVIILLKLCRALSSRLRETDQRVRTFVHLAQWL